MRKLVAVLFSLFLLLAPALPAGASQLPELTVRVSDLAGQPLAGASVEVYGLDRGLLTLAATGADGTARLPYEPGQRQLWLVRVSAGGYRVQESGWFDPAYGAVKAFWLEPAGGDLQVLVRSQSGERVEAEVALLTSSGRLVAQAAAKEGRFAQGGLPAGEYRLVAAANGFAPVERQVSIAAGRMTVETIALNPGSFTASGEVVDATTLSPLAGARVELIRAGGAVVAEGQTAVGGRFALAPAVPGGSFQLRVSAPGYAPASTAAQAVAPGGYLDFSGLNQIRLAPLTGAIQGNLLNLSGLPVPETKVTLLREGFGEVATTKTNTEGAFRFEGVAAGPGVRYQVVADSALDNVNGRWHDLLLSDWVEAKPGATVQISVVAKSWYSLTFSPGMVTGRVVTPAGLPVEGATVELIRQTRVQSTTTTDANGSFTFASADATERDGFATAPYMIRIAKDGFVATREVSLEGNRVTTFALPVRARLALEATLHPALSDLRGRVVDPQGRPVAGARVALGLNDKPEAQVATTGADGWYRLTAVDSAAAAAVLRVTAPGYLEAGVDVTAALGGASAPPTVQLTPRTSVVEGVAVDFGGKPVGGAAVRLYSGGVALATALTDPDGYYQVEADLTGASVALLTVERDGYAGGGAVLTDLPAPGQRASRSLLISQAAALVEGRALDSAGKPLSGVEVELLVEGKGAVQRAITGPDGSYRFELPLPEGAGWAWLRAKPLAGRFGGSASHGLDYAPLTRLTAGDRLVIDLLVRP